VRRTTKSGLQKEERAGEEAMIQGHGAVQALLESSWTSARGRSRKGVGRSEGGNRRLTRDVAGRGTKTGLGGGGPWGKSTYRL